MDDRTLQRHLSLAGAQIDLLTSKLKPLEKDDQGTGGYKRLSTGYKTHNFVIHGKPEFFSGNSGQIQYFKEHYP